MTTAVAAPVKMKNVLYLTDFSQASEAALPFAISIARKHAGSVRVLHVLTPAIEESYSEAIRADEELAEAEMRNVRSRIASVACETVMAQGLGVWAAIEREIQEHPIDLIVLGTHGRSGVPKLLLGSVAEEIFRRSSVPILTVGPAIRIGPAQDARFKRVLFATDFTPASNAAASYAMSLAREKGTQLVLLHVMQGPPEGERKDEERSETPGVGAPATEATVTKAIDRLYRIVLSGAELYNPPEVAIEYGEPADRIVKGAKERGADLIVMGVRGAAKHLGAATHLERAVAHKVVAHAHCPVITVRVAETATA
jgi:nucleotide-binding universal stress UspA family protein